MSNEESQPSPESIEALDTEVHAAWARVWSSLSPESPMLAWMVWLTHLATSPGKRAALSDLARAQLEQCLDLLRDGIEAMTEGRELPVLPPSGDRRFNDASWDAWPYNLWRRGYQLQSQWWEQATRGVWGVDPKHRRLVEFCARQWLEMLSPANVAALNPVVLRQTQAENGANLARGF